MLENKTLATAIVESAREALALGKDWLRQIRWFVEGDLDPNDARLVHEDAVGLRYTPMTTKNHRRVGARERVRDVARRHPKRLKIVLHALVTKVLFDDQQRAVGVEYLQGARLYRAHSRPSELPGERRTVRASREVILAGGTFNTPQLLMLSGIGPPETLTEVRHPGARPRCRASARTSRTATRSASSARCARRGPRSRARRSPRATRSSRNGSAAAPACTAATARC